MPDIQTVAAQLDAARLKAENAANTLDAIVEGTISTTVVTAGGKSIPAILKWYNDNLATLTTSLNAQVAAAAASAAAALDSENNSAQSESNASNSASAAATSAGASATSAGQSATSASSSSASASNALTYKNQAEIARDEAEAAAQAAQDVETSLAGGLTYTGDWNASTGSYPSAPSAGSRIYRVSVGGIVSSITYSANEFIVYDVGLGAYRKLSSLDALSLGGVAANKFVRNDQSGTIVGTVSATILQESGVSLVSKYLGINSKAADSNLLDGLDSTAFFLKSGTVVTTGNKEFSGTDISGFYTSSPIYIREVNKVGATQSVAAYAPALSFHWSGRYATQFALEADGIVWARDGGTHATRKPFGASALYENSTPLSSKYLGISATAANSTLLSGYGHSSGAVSGTIALRNGSGDLLARYFTGEYVEVSHGSTTRNSDTVFYSSTDNFIRKNTASGFRTSLNVYSKSESLGISAKAADSDLLDGYNSSTSDVVNTVAVRDGAGDIVARLFKSSYANQSTISGAMAFRVNNTSDQYIRYCSDTSAIKTWLGALSTSGGTVSGVITSTSSTIISGNNGGVVRGMLYNDASGFGFLTNAGAWAAQVPYGTNNLSVYGSISEGGTSLSSKYLGISSIAANSNLLDGINSTSFLRSDESDTLTGNLFVTGYIAEGGTSLNAKYLGISATAANSGLLDGIDSTSFLRSDIDDQITAGTLTFNDGRYLYFGTNGEESRIYSNGTNTYWDLFSSKDLYWTRAGTHIMLLDSSTGDLHVDGDGYFYSTSVGSDPKLKKDIEPILNARESLSKITGVTWNWKDNNEACAGVVSTDVKSVLPCAVSVRTRLNENEEYESVNYNALFGLLLAATNEISSDFEAYKNRSLWTKIKDLFGF